MKRPHTILHYDVVLARPLVFADFDDTHILKSKTVWGIRVIKEKRAFCSPDIALCEFFFFSVPVSSMSNETVNNGVTKKFLHIPHQKEFLTFRPSDSEVQRDF